MFRLLGFLIGSATSIAIILLVTGIPEFHLENPELDQKRFDDAVEKLMARKLDVEQEAIESPVTAIPPIQETKAPAPPDATNAINEEGDIAVASPNKDNNPIAVDSRETDPGEQTEIVPQPLEVAMQTADPQWYSFWNPFRSELAANGFVSQLEKVTGLDYRVVRVKTGVYEVAFAYLNDDERRSKLLQISAATGLDLPDS